MIGGVTRSLNVPLTDEQARDLEEIARREFRRPRDQAAVLLEEAIRRRLARKPPSIAATAR
jgi:hypothetical protein